MKKRLNASRKGARARTGAPKARNSAPLPSHDGHDPALVSKALRAQYVLLAYNILEAGASIFFGAASGSIALLGFGLDSVAETMSTAIVTMRLRKEGKMPVWKERRMESQAFWLVGACFVLLGAYIAWESAGKLLNHDIPSFSLPGALIALASIVFMPYLSRYRHDLGHRLGSNALVADSRQTMLCVYSAVALLAGLGLNYLLGWWWADPAVGLIIAALALYEGKETLEGKVCC
ncbi:MAG: cation transporter [Candidatus Micrarchaeota archaeon]|nr:cation transporter [Candidatus Micrarchaeota archaeon]